MDFFNLTSEGRITQDTTDGVGYQGNVEVGFILNGKKYKKLSTNRGTINLFRYIRDCLAGSYNSAASPTGLIDSRPGGLLLTNSSGSVTSYGFGFTNISLSGDLNTASITFSFLVPAASILKQEITGATLVGISDPTVKYAETTFGSTIRIENRDTSLYVNWTLRIGNGIIQ